MLTRRHPADDRAGRLARAIGWLALVFVIAVFGARAAHAENLGPGGSRIVFGDAAVGPYTVFVTSSPSPAAPGPITYVVRVTDPATGAMIRDAEIRFALRPPGGGAPVEAAATHADAGNQVDYAAHIELETEGSWSGTLNLRGALGEGQVDFVQQVTAQRQLSTIILVGIPFAVVLGVFVAMWVVRGSGRKDAPA